MNDRQVARPGRLSVAVCTRNRAALLREALVALCACEPPPDWEVLVVLNDCSDGSAAVAAEFRTRLPLVLIEEPRAGHSHARNRAVDAAGGDHILWLDDDVRVHSGCLTAYRCALSAWPEAAVLGGPIHPVFTGRPPDWLRAALPVIGAAFARQTVLMDGDAIRTDAVPFGANFVIRTDVQRRHRYDTNLGRAPVGWLRGGEEIDVLTRVLTSGQSGRWVAAAAVDHLIGPDRQTFAYLRQYFEGLGRTAGLARRPPKRRGPLSAALDLIAVSGAELRYTAARAFQPPERWAVRLVKASIRRGKWKASYLR